MNKNTYILIAIAIVVLVGLFYFLKPHTTVAPATTKTQTGVMSDTAADTVTPPTVPTTKTFELTVKDLKLASGPQTITVNDGDNVTIKITSDKEEELHLHGYDKMVDLAPNVPAELNFDATITGRFEYELEHSSTQIGVLEVLPKA